MYIQLITIAVARFSYYISWRRI